MRIRSLFLLLGLIGFIATGCGATIKTYVKPDAPWEVVQKVAVVPFSTPSENPVRRELVTQLFAGELRRAGWVEVIEVPLSSPVGGAPSITKIAQEYGVDAVVSGSVDETHGTVVHVRFQDAATEEMLWSGTYLLGVRAEFFSLATQQQQFQKAFARLVNELKSKANVR